MSPSETIYAFEKKLEVAVKSAFEKTIRQDGEFEISADDETHSRINDVVEGLHLEVYGMTVNPSEFIIKFEFSESFKKINAQSKPKYCKIRLENDGNYYLTMNENDLKKNWYLSIRDVDFNTKEVSEDVINDCVKKFDQNLLLRILSN